MKKTKSARNRRNIITVCLLLIGALSSVIILGVLRYHDITSLTFLNGTIIGVLTFILSFYIIKQRPLRVPIWVGYVAAFLVPYISRVVYSANGFNETPRIPYVSYDVTFRGINSTVDAIQWLALGIVFLLMALAGFILFVLKKNSKFF